MEEYKRKGKNLLQVIGVVANYFKQKSNRHG